MERSNYFFLESVNIDEANAYVDSEIERHKKQPDIDYSLFSGMDQTAFDKYLFNNAPTFSRFDIFLSHKIYDKDVIVKLFFYLETQLGLKVYIDWIVDPLLNRKNVTKKSVMTLKVRMKQSKSFLLAKTFHFRTSRWIMWEVGYYDGVFRKNMAQIDLGMSDIKQLEFLLYCRKAYLNSLGLFIDDKSRGFISWNKWIS